MPQEFPAIRLVALDLDGTLLNREGHVTPRTRAALQAAVDKGVYIVPATGRPLASLPPEVAQLPGIRYVITCNGAAVWDLGADPVGAVYSRYSNAKEHRTSTPVCLLHSLMPVETAREAFAVCESFHADLRIFSDGYACTDARSIALAAARAAQKDSTEARQPNDGRFTILRDAAEWMSRNAFAIEKLCVFFENPQQAAAALPRFYAVPGVEVVQGSPKNVEVTAAGVDKGEALPFDLTGSAIYYVGPTPERPGEVIGSAGPTTSGRMDAMSPRLLDLGNKIMIGKGKRDAAVKEAVVRNGAVYLAALGGAGALMAKSVETLEVIAWPDLGCEAVRRLTVRDMPLTVILDAHGGDLYQSGPAAYLESEN